tara:strand:- start:723 stop:905 length:183 start_codon:yes stop_codon:yes gene_type:complete
MQIKECKYNLFTCVNLLKIFHSKELCETCINENNYEHYENFTLNKGFDNMTIDDFNDLEK